MQVEVNGTRLWFDVEGAALEPDGDGMRDRPTVVLVHGGPGSYDHSYFKPEFSGLAETAQVVYLDLRDHGRSARHDPADWSFELCADDLRAFIDALAIDRPIVLGHSMGGMVALTYAGRHPGHGRGIVASSTMARFDLDRLVDGFRRRGGDRVAALARRSYAGDSVTPGEWAQVFAVFGPHIPTPDQLARRIRNPEVGVTGMELVRRFDITDQLPRITTPTLVLVGELDAPTPVAASEEILAGLRPGIGRLEVLDGAGHFAWLDRPEQYFSAVEGFIRAAAFRSIGTSN